MKFWLMGRVNKWRDFFAAWKAFFSIQLPEVKIKYLIIKLCILKKLHNSQLSTYYSNKLKIMRVCTVQTVIHQVKNQIVRISIIKITNIRKLKERNLKLFFLDCYLINKATRLDILELHIKCNVLI